jgi:hypothetical protein
MFIIIFLVNHVESMFVGLLIHQEAVLMFFCGTWTLVLLSYIKGFAVQSHVSPLFLTSCHFHLAIRNV